MRLPNAIGAEDPGIVPRSGFSVQLTLVTSAMMAMLAVFALALSAASARLADRWSDALADTATVRISAPADQIAGQTEAALEVLRTTPGVGSARALTAEEQRALLSPWFGEEFAVEGIDLPQLIEVEQVGDGFDAVGLRARLAGEVPGAVLDDHARWREPLVDMADRVRRGGYLAVALIAATMVGLVTLAAQAALSANAQVIGVLRLVGAKDGYIARAFVRRFTLRALVGSAIGAVIALLLLLLVPRDAEAIGGLLGTGPFGGATWLGPLVVPPVAALTAYVATRLAAMRVLRRSS